MQRVHWVLSPGATSTWQSMAGSFMVTFMLQLVGCCIVVTWWGEPEVRWGGKWNNLSMMHYCRKCSHMFFFWDIVYDLTSTIWQECRKHTMYVCDGPIWAQERCRISPSRFLAKCPKKWLNQGVFCFVCLFWVVFSFCIVCIFICLRSCIFQHEPTWMALYSLTVPMWFNSFTHSLCVTCRLVGEQWPVAVTAWWSMCSVVVRSTARHTSGLTAITSTHSYTLFVFIPLIPTECANIYCTSTSLT